MRSSMLMELLQEVASGAVDPKAAAARLAPTADLGFANLDIHREARSGLPEAVLGEGKSLDELIAITDKLIEIHGRVLVTRLDQERAAELSRRHEEAT